MFCRNGAVDSNLMEAHPHLIPARTLTLRYPYGPCQMRLMKMERELNDVRRDRDRNELYLTRILREVDQKVS